MALIIYVATKLLVIMEEIMYISKSQASGFSGCILNGYFFSLRRYLHLVCVVLISKTHTILPNLKISEG